MALRFSLRQLEYFVTVGEEGSIALAAERLNVSSPSISAAISRLEAEFGLQLFVRKHAHGLSLTQAGRQFLAKAHIVLAEADGLNRLAGDLSGVVQGPLAVGCLLTFAQLILPGLRRQFETLYPAVRIHQFELHQMEIFNRLQRAEIDIALTYDLEIPSSLEFIPLVELAPFALVSAAHPLAHLSAVTVGELKDHDMVLLDLPLSSDYFLSFFTQIGAKPKITERTQDMAVMRSLVANGFGYAIANIRPLSDRAPDGQPLKFIPLTGNVRQMKLGLVMAKGAKNVLTVNAFIEHCRQQISENRSPGMTGHTA